MEVPKDLKSRVIAKLIAEGFNPKEAKKMVAKNIGYACRIYKTEKHILECIKILGY